MPSNAMYLAIAKKYLENHNEENSEEFYKGIITKSEKKTHKPNLNEYYNQIGIKDSFHRGNFLRLTTDYLFYNHFLKKISKTILNDFRKANKKIISKYELEIPEEIAETIKFLDGELEEINEDSIYKFINTVAGLDLEKYAQQERKNSETQKLELVGKKEGLLYKYKGGAFLKDYTEMYLYGFENNYGVLIEKTIGGMTSTEGSENGLYQVTPIGLSLKPSEIWDNVDVQALREPLSTEEKERLISLSQEDFSNEINTALSLRFQNVSKDKLARIVSLVKKLPGRQPLKTITDREINLNCLNSDEIFVE